MFDNDEKIAIYAGAFAMASAGCLILAFIPSVIGIRQVQKAQAFNLIADGYRQASLAKTYDAKAAALAMKTAMNEVVK